MTREPPSMRQEWKLPTPHVLIGAIVAFAVACVVVTLLVLVL